MYACEIKIKESPTIDLQMWDVEIVKGYLL
jgi:hypothetical protein